MSEIILNIEIKDIDFVTDKDGYPNEYKKELVSENETDEKYKLLYIPQSSNIDIKEYFFPERESIKINENSVRVAGIVFKSDYDEENKKISYKLLERDDLLINCIPIDGKQSIRKMNISLTHANTQSCLIYIDTDDMKRKCIKRNVFEEKLNTYIDFSNNSISFSSNAQFENILNEKDIGSSSISAIILEIEVEKNNEK